MANNRNKGNEERKLTGAELKSLMVDGQLPKEYQTVENMVTLRNYECDLIKSGESDGGRIIIDCTKFLALHSEEHKRIDRWFNSFEDTKKAVEEYNREIQLMHGLNFMNLLTGEMKKTPELKEEADSITESMKHEFGAEPLKEIKRRRFKFTLKTHFASLMIAVAIALPIALLVSYTGLFAELVERMSRGDTPENITIEEFMAREYDSIEAFEVAHNISLLIPTWLPGGLEVERVDYLEGSLYIHHTDRNTVLVIEFNMSIPNTEGMQTHEYNGITFYTLKHEGIIRWEYDGDFYDIQFGFNINEYAIRIIENIR